MSGLVSQVLFPLIQSGVVGHRRRWLGTAIRGASNLIAYAPRVVTFDE